MSNYCIYFLLFEIFIELPSKIVDIALHPYPPVFLHPYPPQSVTAPLPLFSAWIPSLTRKTLPKTWFQLKSSSPLTARWGRAKGRSGRKGRPRPSSARALVEDALIVYPKALYRLLAANERNRSLLDFCAPRRVTKAARRRGRLWHLTPDKRFDRLELLLVDLRDAAMLHVTAGEGITRLEATEKCGKRETNKIEEANRIARTSRRILWEREAISNL